MKLDEHEVPASVSAHWMQALDCAPRNPECDTQCPTGPNVWLVPCHGPACVVVCTGQRDARHKRSPTRGFVQPSGAKELASPTGVRAFRGLNRRARGKLGRRLRSDAVLQRPVAGQPCRGPVGRLRSGRWSGRVGCESAIGCASAAHRDRRGRPRPARNCTYRSRAVGSARQSSRSSGASDVLAPRGCTFPRPSQAAVPHSCLNGCGQMRHFAMRWSSTVRICCAIWN